MERPQTILPPLMRDNAAFFIPFALFLVIGAGMLSALQLGDEVFFFSAHRSQWGDLFFRYATILGDGLFFIVGLVVLLFVRFRYAAVLPLLGTSVSLVTQTTKKLFAHPRPAAFFREHGLFDQFIPVEGVVVHGGHNSFPSGHTMTAFALFAFLSFCLAPRYRRSGVFFFLLALAAGISRIYLGQHFLEDVYLGAILGVLLAVLFYYWADRLDGRRRPWLDRSLPGAVTRARQPQANRE